MVLDGSERVDEILKAVYSVDTHDWCIVLKLGQMRTLYQKL